MRSTHVEEFEDCAEENTRLQRFSVKQSEFLHAYAATPYMSEAALCREIGVPKQSLNRWKKESPVFKRAMQEEYRRSQTAANMNRKTIVRGMLEAVDLARDQRQPTAMISGYKEIARMCGYYEPERREILLSVDSKQLLEQIQTLPKAKLLELWHEHDTDPVEGDFEVVDTD